MNSALVITGGQLVYVGIDKREEFDEIALAAIDHGDRGERGHVLSKSIDHDGVYVVFQHWLRSPLAAAIAILPAIAILLALPAASASPSCMSLSEARHVSPNRHLWRHGSEHCWDDRHGLTRRAERRRAVPTAPIPKARPDDVPVKDWIYADRWWLS